MKQLMSVRREIVVKVAGREIGRVDITHCRWCTEKSVCTACHARAENMRRAGWLVIGSTATGEVPNVE